MADILEAVFRRHGGLNLQPQTGERGVFSPRSTECSSVVLAVERGISSALLFLTAVTAAADLDHKVLFYTHAAIQKFPVPVNDSMPDLKPDSLKVLTLKTLTYSMLAYSLCIVFTPTEALEIRGLAPLSIWAFRGKIILKPSIVLSLWVQLVVVNMFLASVRDAYPILSEEHRSSTIHQQLMTLKAWHYVTLNKKLTDF